MINTSTEAAKPVVQNKRVRLSDDEPLEVKTLKLWLEETSLCLPRLKEMTGKALDDLFVQQQPPVGVEGFVNVYGLSLWVNETERVLPLLKKTLEESFKDKLASHGNKSG